MFVSLFLVAFGVYLGQEFKNLPLVKTMFLNFVNYVQKVQQENQTNTQELQKQNSVFNKLFMAMSYLNFWKSGHNANANANANGIYSSNFNDSFFESNTLKKRQLDVLSEEENEGVMKRSKEYEY